MLKTGSVFLFVMGFCLVVSADEDFTVMSYACSNDNGYGFAIHINSYNQMKAAETMLTPVDGDPSSYEFNYTDGKGDVYNHLLTTSPTFSEVPPQESFFVEYRIRVTTALDGKTKSKTIEAFCNPIQ